MGKLSIELQELLEAKHISTWFSDTIEDMDDIEIIVVAASALLKSYEVTRVLREFLEKVIEDRRGERLPPLQ